MSDCAFELNKVEKYELLHWVPKRSWNNDVKTWENIIAILFVQDNKPIGVAVIQRPSRRIFSRRPV